MLMLPKTLEIADTVKMMFGEMINAIEEKRCNFSFDPAYLFAGPMSTGQIDAYDFCANGLEEVGKYLASCFRACEADFNVLRKLT